MVYLTKIQKQFNLDPTDLLRFVQKSKIPVHISAAEAGEIILLVPIETIRKLKVHNQCEFSDKKRTYENSNNKYVKTEKSILRTVSYEKLMVSANLVYLPLSNRIIFYTKNLSRFLFKGSVFKISGNVEQVKVIEYFIDQCQRNNEKLEKYAESPSTFFYDSKRKEDAVFYKKVIVGYLKDFFRVSPRNKMQSVKRSKRPKYIMHLIDDSDFEIVRRWCDKTKKSR